MATNLATFEDTMDNTRYLYRLGSTYYFRCRIPKDLHPWFNDKHEYKCSLRTKSSSSAKRLVIPHISRTESTFILMRSGLLDEEHLKRLAHEYITYGSTGRRKKVCSGAAASIGSSNSLDVTNQVAQVSKDRLLSTIIEKYIQEHKDTENIAKTTIYELETKCRQFVRVVGDMDVKAVMGFSVLRVGGVQYLCFV